MDRNKLLVRVEGKICCSELPNRKIAADLLFFSAHEIVSKLPISIYTARSCMKTISRSDVCLPVNRVWAFRSRSNRLTICRPHPISALNPLMLLTRTLFFLNVNNNWFQVSKVLTPQKYSDLRHWVEQKNKFWQFANFLQRGHRWPLVCLRSYLFATLRQTGNKIYSV
jgi:hypothetical protein